MNIVRWDPFRDLDRAFDRRSALEWQPPVDIRESKEGYRVEVELPAIDRKDVRIELKERILLVAGERRPADGEHDARLHRRERRYGKFSRSFRLPEDADPNAIRAAAKDGVVTIDVAKRATAQPREIEVQAA